MSLHTTLGDPHRRQLIAADAVAEASDAVSERTGIAGVAVRLGLDTINRLRPGFLLRHVDAMLPDLALAIEPHWQLGQATTTGRVHLELNAFVVTNDLLVVADAYVARASDRQAIMIYNQLRVRAPHRISEQMPRIAAFVERHTPPPR